VSLIAITGQLVTVSVKVSCCRAGRLSHLISPIDFKLGNDRVERMVRPTKSKVPVIEFMLEADKEVRFTAFSTKSVPSSCSMPSNVIGPAALGSSAIEPVNVVQDERAVASAWEEIVVVADTEQPLTLAEEAVRQH